MHRPDARDPNDDVLPEALAARLLTRASELDAATRTGAAIADLRAAAVEAGISTQAFDAALAEMPVADSGDLTRVTAPPPPRSRTWIIAVAIAAVAALGAIAVSRNPSATPIAVADAVPMIQEAFLVRCLSAEQAAELTRPILNLRTNTAVISPQRAPGVLTVRGTAEQLQKVRALLDSYEAPGAGACTPRS